MNFFLGLTKDLLSPRALKGFIIGLGIGGLLLIIHIAFLHPIVGDPEKGLTSTHAAYLVGAILVAIYGYWFAKRTRSSTSLALFLFFLFGLFGIFLGRLVFEKLGYNSAILTHNVISYMISSGITCALAGGFFEILNQPE